MRTRAPARALGATIAAMLAMAALLKPTPARAADADSPTLLPLSGGARAFALAGASVALIDDAGAAFVNPARLAFLGGRSFTAGYGRLVEGVPSERIEVAYGQPIGGDVAAPLQRGRVHRLALGLALDYQRLELSQGSEYGEFTGSLAAAFAPFNFLSVGASARGFRSQSPIDELEANGSALDLGASVALLPNLEGAVVIHNLLGRVRYPDSEDESPGNSLSAGLALTRMRWIALEADFTSEFGGGRSYAAGVELVPGGVLALRGGARYWDDANGRLVPAAGVGFRYGSYFLDYGVQIGGDEGLGLAHRVTLGGRP